MTRALNELGLAELARRIRNRETTSEAVVTACIERIEAREPAVGAFACYAADAALAAARKADAVRAGGPLHGVPFGIKDIIDTDSFPTAWGTGIYAGHQPARNASCVEQFILAGAIPFGKTVTTELAYFRPGKTANPRNLEHTPGGSSSGSAAAVADNMLPFAFGSQTAASLIRPAAYCGVPGYKASHGSFDLQGVMALAPSLDTLGFLAREVEDFELARAVLCGSEGAPQPDPDAAPLRISLFRGPHWREGSVEMRDACQRALAVLGAAGAQTGELGCPQAFEALTGAQQTVMAFEVVRARVYEYSRFRDSLSPQFLELYESGLAVGRRDYEAALAARDRAARVLASMFVDCDVILAPAAPGEAPQGLGATGDPLFSRAWNLLQVPCLSLPCGAGPNGLPLSVQIVGRYNGDDDLLAAAKWIHARLDNYQKSNAN